MKRCHQTPYGKLRAAFNEGKSRVLNGKTDRHIPKEEFLRIWNSETCGIRQLPVTDSDKSLDHIAPIARGGSNELSNLQIARLVCNQRKSDNLVC